MLRLEHDDAFYQHQCAIGPERARHCSWHETTKQLLQLYRDVYSELNQ
jgi:hypothetical protein